MATLMTLFAFLIILLLILVCDWDELMEEYRAKRYLDLAILGAGMAGTLVAAVMVLFC